MNNYSDNCLFCNTIVPRQEEQVEQWVKDSSLINDKRLELQLSVFFIVAELLQISKDTCCQLLINHGNPKEWINICSDCSKLVEEGRELFQKIEQLQKKYKLVQETVKMKILVKPEPDSGISKNSATEAIRTSVKVRYNESIGEAQEQEDGCEWIIKPIKRKYKRKGILQEVSKEKATRKKRKNLKQEEITTHPVTVKVEEAFESETLINVPVIEAHSQVEFSPEVENEEIEDDFLDHFREGSDTEFQLEDPLAATDFELNSDESDSDFEITPEKKSKKLTKKKNPTKEKTNKKPRVSATKIKVPIKEKLTLEQVISMREEIMKNVSPFTKDMPEEQAKERSKFLRLNSISSLCNIHKVDSFPCPTCSQVYDSHKQWNEHVNIKMCNMGEHYINKSMPLVVERLTCEKCGMKIGSAFVLEEHYRAAHYPSEIFTCRGCSVIFKTGTAYNGHYYDTLKSNPSSECVTFGLKCPYKDICRRTVRNSQEALDIHLTTRHTEKPPDTFKCIECEKTFPSKCNLKKHLETHMTAEIMCDRCSSKFKTIYRLKQHVNTVHLSKEGAPKYPCRICEKEFRVHGQRTRHELIHNSESPHICDICAKSFKIANYLTIHMWSHDPKMKGRFERYKNNAKARAELKQTSEDTFPNEIDN